MALLVLEAIAAIARWTQITRARERRKVLLYATHAHNLEMIGQVMILKPFEVHPSSSEGDVRKHLPPRRMGD